MTVARFMTDFEKKLLSECVAKDQRIKELEEELNHTLSYVRDLSKILEQTNLVYYDEVSQALIKFRPILTPKDKQP
jgi:hypothetical protein